MVKGVQRRTGIVLQRKLTPVPSLPDTAVAALAAFNSASPAAARDFLRPCVDIPRWVDELVDGRPYPDVAALLAAARTAAPDWSEAELDGALARHPRIGERAAGTDAEAAFSRREQSGVSPEEAVQERLRAGNQAYEEKFGRVFLIRAAGRSAEEILSALEARLANTPEDELPVIAGQLREIALLRLEGLFTA